MLGFAVFALLVVGLLLLAAHLRQRDARAFGAELRQQGYRIVALTDPRLAPLREAELMQRGARTRIELAATREEVFVLRLRQTRAGAGSDSDVYLVHWDPRLKVPRWVFRGRRLVVENELNRALFDSAAPRGLEDERLRDFAVQGDLPAENEAALVRAIAEAGWTPAVELGPHGVVTYFTERSAPAVEALLSVGRAIGEAARGFER